MYLPVQFAIVDDGTLDTVVACRICGDWIQRYSPDLEGDVEFEDFRDWVTRDAEETHDCDARRLLSPLFFAHLKKHLDCEGVCPVRDAIMAQYRLAKTREQIANDPA